MPIELQIANTQCFKINLVIRTAEFKTGDGSRDDLPTLAQAASSSRPIKLRAN